MPFVGSTLAVLYNNNIKDSSDFYSLVLSKLCQKQHILVFYYVSIIDSAVYWHGREHMERMKRLPSLHHPSQCWALDEMDFSVHWLNSTYLWLIVVGFHWKECMIWSFLHHLRLNVLLAKVFCHCNLKLMHFTWLNEWVTFSSIGPFPCSHCHTAVCIGAFFLPFKKTTTQHYCIFYSDHYPVHQVEPGQVSLFSSVFTLSLKYYHNLCYWPKFWLQIIQNYFLQP